MIWNQVIAYWEKLGLPIRTGVTWEEIAQFEEKYGVALPADVSCYFRAVDGTGIDESDEHITSFLSLAELRPVDEWLDRSEVYPSRFAYPNCFIFADHLLSSWLYAVQMTPESHNLGPVFLVTGDFPIQQKARSFKEFMLSYQNDPQSIL